MCQNDSTHMLALTWFYSQGSSENDFYFDWCNQRIRWKHNVAQIFAYALRKTVFNEGKWHEGFVGAETNCPQIHWIMFYVVFRHSFLHSLGDVIFMKTQEQQFNPFSQSTFQSYKWTLWATWVCVTAAHVQSNRIFKWCMFLSQLKLLPFCCALFYFDWNGSHVF